MSAALSEYVGRIVLVVTCDGRTIVGVLKGFDQTTNVILAQSHERIFSEDEGVQRAPLGLYLVRGDNVALVGEMDESRDLEVDWSRVKSAALKPVVH